jgi:hypothetical protein
MQCINLKPHMATLGIEKLHMHHGALTIACIVEYRRLVVFVFPLTWITSKSCVGMVKRNFEFKKIMFHPSSTHHTL